MRIRNGFRLCLAIGGLIFTAAIISFGFNQLRISEAASFNETIDSLSVECTQLAQLTNEVLLYGENRAIEQWQQQYKDIDLLFRIQKPAEDARTRELLTRLAASVADTYPLMDKLLSERNRGQRQARDIIEMQLFKKATLLQAAARNLKTHADVQQKAVFAESKKRLLTTFILFAGTSAIFSIAVFYLFRNFILRPIQAMETTIRQIQSGERAQRAHVLRQDEIGTVCEAFNGLLDQQEESLREIEFLAFHDVLTGLPNQAVAKDRLIQATAYADRSGTKVALMFLDLDNFKAINDSLGHPTGDALLKAVAARLRAAVREIDTVSRQGGDEFIITFPDFTDAEGITIVAEKLLQSLSTTYEVDGHELASSVSIGIAVYPDDSRDFDTLLKKADTAMYEAKAAGRNAFRFFTEQMNVETSEYQQTRNGLQRALERGEFVLHYQPQINLSTGAVIGAEALIRWQHSTQGMVPPGRFIPVAEDSGLIVPIGEWVLREACRQAAFWRENGMPGLTVAINLSAVQFKRGNVEQTVIAAIRDAGVDPAGIELELTESLLIKDTESVLTTVRQLKSIGVKLSIDDFGTGYSSLSYLKRFKVDKLKIDQSFVRDLATDPEDAAIVRAIIQMAHSLNLQTVAEGVETEQMLDMLTIYRCDEVQGYHFARPMPADEFERFVRNRQGASLTGRRERTEDREDQTFRSID